MKLLEGLLIFVACAVAGMAVGLLINHVLEDVQMQEHKDLERLARQQRTCVVCGSLAKPTMRNETARPNSEPVVDYDCECGNTWTALPIHEQARLRTKDIRWPRKDAP